MELDLSIFSNIIEPQGQISFEFELTFPYNNETFFFFINDDLISEYNKSGKYNKTIDLKSQNYKFKWKYQRINSNNDQNAVEINKIILKGSENGFSSSCSSCPYVQKNLNKGTVRDYLDPRKKCVYCSKGFIPNEKSIIIIQEETKCIKCPEGTYNKRDESIKCKRCPEFTVSYKKFDR